MNIFPVFLILAEFFSQARSLFKRLWIPNDRFPNFENVTKNSISSPDRDFILFRFWSESIHQHKTCCSFLNEYLYFSLFYLNNVHSCLDQRRFYTTNLLMVWQNLLIYKSIFQEFFWKIECSTMLLAEKMKPRSKITLKT